MKKHTFLVFHREYRQFLEQLGTLGVLHVIERGEAGQDEAGRDEAGRDEAGRDDQLDDQLDEKEARLARIQDVLELLRTAEKEFDEVSRVHPRAVDADDIIREVELLEENIDLLKHQIEEIRKEKEKFEPWGNYDPRVIRSLEQSGYRPWLLKCPARQYDPAWEERDDLYVISKDGGQVYMLLLAKPEEEPGIEAEYHRPPDRSLEEITRELETLEKQKAALWEKLAGMARTVPKLLQGTIRQLESEISLMQVYQETRKASGDALMILEGWVPEKSEKQVAQLAEEMHAVNLVTSPEEGEQPPVELRNGRFSRLFEPISKLFDLPAYGEMDLTPYFAPFFMLFFGFCLGDAGYGVFFILFATILKLRVKKELKPILSLTQYLGVATILFGLLSGTFFGVNLIDSGYTLTASSMEKIQAEELPAGLIADLRSVEGTYYSSREDFSAAVGTAIGDEAMQQYNTTILKSAEAGIPLVSKFRHLMQDSLSMFYLALLIGGVQIVFGIFIKIFNITRQKGFKYALSTLGWFVLILALVANAAGLLPGPAGKYSFYGLLGVSGILIFFLNNPGKNIFAQFGAGIWDSYGMVTGIFGDLLSYIRLFALGISSAILGFVFNDISLQLLNIPYVGWLFFLVLLLAGHSINLFLATLGGFIHPMRLTFVEFYKNAGFQGGGKKYHPFTMHNSYNQ
jgi:V/A-type H+-transporting ATPase subunit I